jgi:hypothetical protein
MRPALRASANVAEPTPSLSFMTEPELDPADVADGSEAAQAAAEEALERILKATSKRAQAFQR